MPAPVPSADRRNSSLLTVLFWIGVAIAPVAALILLVADGNGPLRFAAVLAILAVVLIGLSIALRADGAAGSARVEELMEEVEQLRRELRGEIVAAAQRGNQALDQAQRAQEAVVVLRHRLDATSAALAGGIEQAGAARVPAAEPGDEPVSGRVRVPGQDEESSPWGRADRADGEEPARRRTSRSAGTAGVYGGDRPSAGTAGVYGGDRQSAGTAGVYGGDRPSAGTAGVYGGDRQSTGTAGVYGAAWQPEQEPRSEPAARPLGMVRHTETVHVTTRHTIVDGAAAVPGGGTAYGSGYAGRWSSAPEEQPWAGHGQSDERHRPGYGEPEDRFRRDDDRSWSASDALRNERSRDDRDRAGQRDDRDRAGQRDDREWPGQQWDDRAPQWDGPGQRDERSWSEQRDDRGWSGAGGQDWAGSAEQSGGARSYRPDDSDVESGEYWSQLRAGDRWAAVRDDDRGRELRVGERRAEVHADATGTEYRVADRWASIRRDEPHRGQDRGGDDGWRGGGAERESVPALPAGGVPVPDEWRPPRQRQPEPEGYGWRQEERYGYPPQEDGPRAGGAGWR